jgi:hypothetical protein
MSSKPPSPPKSTAKQASDIVTWTCGLLGLCTLLGWAYKVPHVYPIVTCITAIFRPLTSVCLYKLFGTVNPAVQTSLTVLIVTFALLFLATPLVPHIERRLIRNVIRRGERQANKIQQVRDTMQVKLKAKNNDTAR